jgi:hypothetical protein
MSSRMRGMKAIGLSIMTGTISNRARPVLLAAALLAAALSPAYAGIKDYEFQLTQLQVKTGSGAVLAVRLIDKRSGKTVPDAVIFASRLDMTPDGMPTMTTAIETLPSTEPGIYRFKADPTMAGGWQLSLAAKIQGETGTLESKLALTVVP